MKGSIVGKEDCVVVSVCARVGFCVKGVVCAKARVQCVQGWGFCVKGVVCAKARVQCVQGCGLCAKGYHHVFKRLCAKRVVQRGLCTVRVVP